MIDIFLHLDTHLAALASQYGAWINAILFVIVFCETGLVVTPFLPGDSLLFVTGALAAAPDGPLNVHGVAALLLAAAVLGDTVNYTVGRHFGARLFRDPDSRLFRRDYLLKAQRFYARHGRATIVLARFVPIVRTFAPFVAGMGSMRYPTFMAYNAAGGLAWVGLFVYGGYLFGNLPVVRDNLTVLALAIVVVSILPGVWHALRSSRT